TSPARPSQYHRARKDKDLAGVNQIRIADLFPVRLVNDGIARAHTISEPAEAPEAIAAGDGGGCDLRQNHGGGRASVWQNGRHGGRQLRRLRAASRMELATWFDLDGFHNHCAGHRLWRRRLR